MLLAQCMVSAVDEMANREDLELEIVKSLRKSCVEIDRPISLALEAFLLPCKPQLNQYMYKRY